MGREAQPLAGAEKGLACLDPVAREAPTWTGRGGVDDGRGCARRGEEEPPLYRPDLPSGGPRTGEARALGREAALGRGIAGEGHALGREAAGARHRRIGPREGR